MKELKEIEFSLIVKLATYNTKEIIEKQDEIARRLINILENIVHGTACIGDVTTVIRGQE